MKQALHIFAKDTRRLWPQIAAVAALFAVHALLSPDTDLNSTASLFDWNGIPAALVVLACWTLGVSVVHEDGLAQESPFWLTRPYDRTSLVGAKILFLFAFVFVPLLLTGVVLEVRSGASVPANAGTLLAFCLGRSLWLILPAVALGVVTRSLLDFAGGLLALWALLFLTSSRGHGWMRVLYGQLNPLENASTAAILPLAAAGIAVVGLQFVTRRTKRSRRFLVAAVLISGFLASMDSVSAFWLRATNPGFDPRPIQMTFNRSEAIHAQLERRTFCATLPLKVEGLGKNRILRSTGGSATTDRLWFTTPSARKVEMEETQSGYLARICPVPFTPEPIALRVTLQLEVIEVSPIATIPVKRGLLNAAGEGRCEVVEDVTDQLRCALAEPASGVIAAGLRYPGYTSFTRGLGDSGTFQLSPMLRQKFYGISRDMPAGWPMDEALKRGDAQFVLRSEHVVGSVSRTLVYEGFRLPLVGGPPPPRPKR